MAGRAYEEPAHIVIARLQREMDQIKRDVYGVPEHGTEGLLQTQRKIVRSLETIYRLIIGVSIASGLILLVVVVLVSYLLRQWLG